jgi:hypothetical protein
MTHGPAPARRTRLMDLTAVAAGTALGGAAFHRGFAWHALAAPIACASVVAVAVTAACSARRRLPLRLSVGISLLAWAVVGVAVVFRPDLRAAAPWGVLPAAADGLLNGWAGFLNMTLPAPATPGLLAVPFTLTWLAAMAGAETALRTRTALAPAVPFLALFAVAVALTVPGEGSDTLLTAGVVAVLLILAVVRRPARPGYWPSARGAGSAAISVVLAAAVAAAATGVQALLPLLDGRPPVDPRHYRPVRLTTETQNDLLQELPAWQAAPNVPLFQVSAARPQYWRLAVLDHFDGRTWTSDGRFTAVGGSVPPTAGRVTGPATIRQRFLIQELTGLYLPEAGRPVRADGASLAVDLGTGTLISTAALAPGLRYTLDSAPNADYGPVQLNALIPVYDPAGRDAPEPTADLPPAILQLADLVKSVTAAAPTPYAQLAFLQRYLPAHYGLDARAPGGSAAANLDGVLAGSQPATVGQLAAIFALTAQALGFPSRLAVGFRPGAELPGASTYQVISGDAVAWPEVDFATVGWTPFYFGTMSTPPSLTSQAGGAAPSSAFAAPSVPAATATPPGTGASATATTASTAWRTVATASTVGAFACYAVAVTFVPALRRRRRRTRGSAADRILGAWRDVLDTVRAAGTDFPRSATNTKIARLATGVAGDRLESELTWLSRHVDNVLFAAHAATTREIRGAWLVARRTRAVALRSASPTRRLAMVLGPHRLIRGAAPTRSRRH